MIDAKQMRKIELNIAKEMINDNIKWVINILHCILPGLAHSVHTLRKDKLQRQAMPELFMAAARSYDVPTRCVCCNHLTSKSLLQTPNTT